MNVTITFFSITSVYLEVRLAKKRNVDELDRKEDKSK